MPTCQGVLTVLEDSCIKNLCKPWCLSRVLLAMLPFNHGKQFLRQVTRPFSEPMRRRMGTLRRGWVRQEENGGGWI